MAGGCSVAPGSGRSSIISSSAPSRNLSAVAQREIAKLVQQFVWLGETDNLVVAFTSAEAQESTSLVVAASADMLAAITASSVCAVDTNVWSPKLHSHFGVANRSGLTELLTEPKPVSECASRVLQNLWLISAGETRDQRSLMRSEQMRNRLLELRQQFRYVLLSAPAVEECVDSLPLGRLADWVVLVLEANKTRRDAAQRAKQILETSGARVLGAVLNNCKSPALETPYTQR